MSDKSFAESVGYILGTRADVIGLFCPGCAASRMKASVAQSEVIGYVETVKQAGVHARCVGCQRFPLVLQAQELLRPAVLLDFMGRVLRMGERLEQESGR